MFNEKPSAKLGNRVQRVKVLNYLKKVALFGAKEPKSHARTKGWVLK